MGTEWAIYIYIYIYKRNDEIEMLLYNIFPSVLFISCWDLPPKYFASATRAITCSCCYLRLISYLKRHQNAGNPSRVPRHYPPTTCKYLSVTLLNWNTFPSAQRHNNIKLAQYAYIWTLSNLRECGQCQYQYSFGIRVDQTQWANYHTIGLGHETMVCAVCLSIFLYLYCISVEHDGRST